MHGPGLRAAPLRPCCALGARGARPAARARGGVACAAPSKSDSVYACPLPEARKEEDSAVYACLLPEAPPPVPRWQFWRRRRAPRVPAPAATAAPSAAPARSADMELQQVKLSQARWEEQEARLRVVSEAYRTAELAKLCGDLETAAKLRSNAAVWAMQEPSAGAMGSALSVLASGAPERMLPAPSREVVVEVRSLADMPGVREISARVDVQAPAEMVWRTLTDYERLADIVPSLNENRILERWSGGVRLLQVAAQELAWGLKFSATATLDIEELPNGINATQRDGSSRRTGSRLIIPRSPGPPPQSVRDICFTLVESRDLKYFSGTWRIEQRDTALARLIYAVEVQPQPWLPISLIADRVSKDLRGNLAAVRDHAEELGQSAVALPKLLQSGKQ